MQVLHLFQSDGHNYIGHHGHPAGTNTTEEVEEIECVAGRGISGDRFFDHAENFHGQITFFADEVYQELSEKLKIADKPVSVLRRNVVTRGIDLNELIGQEFEIQGIRFRGTEECRPCYWMNQAFGQGSEDALKGRGGLRAEILSDGILRKDSASQ
jgi:MOSC domain-containing protein YiiM